MLLSTLDLQRRRHPAAQVEHQHLEYLANAFNQLHALCLVLNFFKETVVIVAEFEGK